MGKCKLQTICVSLYMRHPATLITMPIPIPANYYYYYYLLLLKCSLNVLYHCSFSGDPGAVLKF